jgi:hypothetical protein
MHLHAVCSTIRRILTDVDVYPRFWQEGRPMVSDTDALTERVDHLIHRKGESLVGWGNPLLSTTPTSMAIRDLAERIEVLEEAVREIALQMERLADGE